MDYSVIPTYPAIMALPASISDIAFKKIASFRTRYIHHHHLSLCCLIFPLLRSNLDLPLLAMVREFLMISTPVFHCLWLTQMNPVSLGLPFPGIIERLTFGRQIDSIPLLLPRPDFFGFRKRAPILSYHHPSGGALLRSSQPKRGVTGNNSRDETYLDTLATLGAPSSDKKKNSTSTSYQPAIRTFSLSLGSSTLSGNSWGKRRRWLEQLWDPFKTV